MADESGRHSEFIFNIQHYVLAAGEHPFELFEVGGDSMASVHIVKDRELLTNIRHADHSITVIGLTGEREVSVIGDFGPFQIACMVR